MAAQSSDLTKVTQLKQALHLSQQRYDRIVAEVEDYAILILTTDGIISSWNKGAEKIKGYTESEIIGQHYQIFYTPEDRLMGLPAKLLAEATSLGKANHEGWRVRKNKSRFWGSITITALHDDAGTVTGYLKVTRDLTERKLSEDATALYIKELRQTNQELHRSEERYHKMISEVQDYVIILLDRLGNIQNWNVGAEHIKGYKANEIIGKSFKVFYSKVDQENKLPDRLLQEAVDFGKAIHEGWRVKKDGSNFWGSVVITALHDANGHVIGFSKVTRDLTEKKKADDALKANAKELDQKNKILQQLNKELSSFTYVASHDLKEPLRKILIFTQRLEETEQVTDRGKDSISKIKQSAIWMQSLIEDLLTYSQVSNDSSKYEEIDLNEIINAVKGELELTLHEKGATIKTERLPTIYGVPFQIQQLFSNLLSNSLKFSRTGVTPCVALRATVVTEDNKTAKGLPIRYHQISIKDNGIGFEPEFATKIFDPFKRLHSKNTIPGTGIGLSIVKKVMDNHKGTVVADGQPNIGATFHLYFPFGDQ